MKELWYVDLGLISYSECLSLQMDLLELRHRGIIEDTLLLLEHNPVITMGRSGGEDALLVTPERLAQAGVELYHTDRGGNITYHGPGQLVGYPIFDLRNYDKDVHLFLRNLEQVVIDTIGIFGVKGETIPGLTGVWVDGNKICSIGVAARRWISYHGFAFNVNPNLKHWSLLHPCGLTGKQVTALSLLTNPCPSMDEVKASTVEKIVEVFGMKPVHVSREDIEKLRSQLAGGSEENRGV
ncbi:MAG: lipoyl(octanoyl) transferase LipB [Armatimonadota bacterium]